MHPANCYIHGSAPADQRRLSRLDELLNTATLREFDLVGARTLILSTSHIEENAFDQAIAALITWTTRPDAAFWFAMGWAEGARQ
jgi:hypothetical protein